MRNGIVLRGVGGFDNLHGEDAGGVLGDVGDHVQGLVAAVTLPQPIMDPFLASKTEIVFPRMSFSSPPRVRSRLLLRILRET